MILGAALLALPTDILVFSTADWSQANWTNNQHMSRELARQGFRVLYLESLGLRRPTANKRDLGRIAKRGLKSLRGVRQVAPNIWVFSPLVLPFHQRRWVRRLNQWLVVSSVKLLQWWLGFRQPIVWIYNPIVASFQAQLNPAFLVYHCVDDLTTVPGISPQVVRDAEKTLVAEADAVFVTSQHLKQKLSAIAPATVHYFPNVADYDHFASARSPGALPSDLAPIPAPRIGFIGAIKDYKIDFDLIHALVQRQPDWHWVMVGEVELTGASTRWARLNAPNLHFFGYRAYTSLPDYLRGFDVVVLPCLLNDYTRSMFPMKFFEYLAAGKPIVGTRLPALTAYESLYWPVDSAEAFEQTLRSLLAGDVKPAVEAGIEAARAHTWETRCREMVSLMQSLWAQKQSLSATATSETSPPASQTSSAP